MSSGWPRGIPTGPARAAARIRLPRQNCVSAFLAGASLLLLSGCGRDTSAAGAAVRDSAGITIVDYGEGSPELPQWHLEQVHNSAFSGDRGADVPFYRIRGIVTYASGRTAVANAGSGEIIWFDRNDKLIRTSGRQGDGPGEFRSLSGIYLLHPDSLLAYDGQSMGYQVFDSAGGFVRQFRLQRPGEAPSYPVVLATTDQGELILRSLRSYDDAPQGVSRLGIDIQLYDRDGHFLAPLASIAGWEVFKPADVDRVMFEPLAIPWGRNTELAATPRAVILADNQTGEIRRLSLNGVLEQVFRPPYESRAPVAVDEKETAKERLWAQAPPPAIAMLRAAFADMPLPSQKPLIEAIRAAADGEVWAIETSASDRAPRKVLVLDHEFRIAGTLFLPSQLDVRVISRDYVIGIWTGESGVEQVRRYRISR